MQKPTKKQKQLLDFIEGFLHTHNYSPSYREIRDGLGYRSLAPVAKHIDNLVAKGLLVKRDNSARSLALAGSERQTDDVINTGSTTPTAVVAFLHELLEQLEDVDDREAVARTMKVIAQSHKSDAE